jgi:putative Holliday junction resolvase
MRPCWLHAATIKPTIAKPAQPRVWLCYWESLWSYNSGVSIPLRTLSPADNPRATGVILAIDYGRKRLGLALSDEHGVTARPYATWTRINRRRDLSRLRELVRHEGVRRIVIGLPLHLDGTASEMSEEARGFARRVEKALGLPVEMMDERLSSWEAQEMLAAASSNERKRQSPSGRGKTSKKTAFDDMAAAIILRDFLQRAGIGARD